MTGDARCTGMTIRSCYIHCTPPERRKWSVAFYRHIAPLERKIEHYYFNGKTMDNSLRYINL